MPSETEKSHNTTVSKLTIAPLYMKAKIPEKKYFHAIAGGGVSLVISINSCIRTLNKFVADNGIEHNGIARVFILYDSVRINASPEELGADMARAELEHTNIIADYRSNWFGKVFNMIGAPDISGEYRFLENSEIKALKHFEPMPEGYIAGLGCYYGDLPLGYKFHYNTDDIYSEDINFFRDNKIRWSYWALSIDRFKGFWI